jgi:hypothetical protein
MVFSRANLLFIPTVCMAFTPLGQPTLLFDIPNQSRVRNSLPRSRSPGTVMIPSPSSRKNYGQCVFCSGWITDWIIPTPKNRIFLPIRRNLRIPHVDRREDIPPGTVMLIAEDPLS